MNAAITHSRKILHLGWFSTATLLFALGVMASFNGSAGADFSFAESPLHNVGGYSAEKKAQVLDICPSVTEIPEVECRALEDLYNSTDGDNWTANTDWLTTPQPCSWYGITCASGHVQNLVLEDNGLIGNLPATLSDLTALRILDLRNNQITGGIPASYGTLSVLNHLRLSHNQLIGNIPPALGNLSALTRLDLDYNQLSGSIPVELTDLNNVWYFALHHNELSGPIPPELGSMPSVTYLNLMSNQLSGTIPAELGNLVPLNHLYLHSNQLSGSIPPELGNLTNLRQLGADNNQLSGSIPSSLGNLSNLEGLQLAFNQLTGAIPSSLFNLQNLEWLTLGNNQLSGVLPSAIGNLTNLTWLSLSGNDFSGNVPDTFGNLVAMEQLYLNSNPNLTGPLPLSLTNLVNMNDFRYHNTDLCAPPDAAFQAWLGSIPYLVDTGVICAVDVCAVQTEIPEIECRALEALYNSTDGHEWTENTGWLMTNTPCSWFGVTCSGGHVYSLDLLDNALTGAIPASMGDLVALDTLILHENQLNGPIPPELGNLSNLRQLGAFGNQLSGNIPPSLGNLTQLERLNLSFNQLDGPIPPELGDLKNLVNLGLSMNQLSGIIPPSLGNLTHLEQLILSSNQLSGTIPPELGTMPSLIYLNLHSNQLSGSIPPELGDLVQLQYLNLFSNQLSGSIPPELGNLTNLIQLGLDTNQLSGSIPTTLGNLSNLEFLQLAYNQLSGPVPSTVGDLVALARLTLNDNPLLTGPLPLTLTNLGNLNTFHYNSTDLCAPPDAAFQTWLGSIPDLLGTGVTCAVDVCAVQTEIPEGECRALEDLYNSTDGHGWKDSTDWLSTDTPCSWFGITCKSGHVDTIDLTNNGLIGSIPASIGDLAELTELVLNNNFTLGGDLPPELGNLSELFFLHLRGNAFTGSIPESLGNLTHLYDLRLDENQLSGSIPPELGNMASVRVFEIWGNQLTGSIPAELGNLSYLEYFDLSENQLSGSIPEDLGKLSNLEYLDLNSNRLNGSIPATLGDLSQLQELQLWNNLLSGNIPAELGNLSSVDIISLAGNALTGSIPPELGNLSQMTGYLNLDNNNLTGPIPPELGNLTNLTSLGLFNNQLSGQVPVELGNMINLRGLLLNGNQLSGTLSDDLGNLVLLRALWLHDNPGLTGMLPLTLSDLLLMEQFYFYNTDLCEPPHPYFQIWLNGTYDVRSTEVTCDIPFCSMVTEIPQQECEALEALYMSTDGDNWYYSDGWMERIEPCTWSGVYCPADHVTRLDLQTNGLNGSLPPELGQLGYLEFLNLHDNQLSGSIPPEIGSLGQLQTLYLSQNQLTGSIPASIGNLSSLQNLALRNNQLTGSLPPSMGQLSNLEYLSLGENPFSGTLPPEWGNLSQLTYLSIYRNPISGMIPPEWGNLSNLEDLRIVSTQIGGVIPAEFGNLTALEFLWLADSQLTGPLPPELGYLPNLKGLYLMGNQLTGTLPDAWGSFPNILIIDVYDNPLSGPVPMSFINLSTLHTLGFDRTNICEPPEPAFQDWLSTLTLVSSTGVICPNTAVGTDVEVTPIDYASGTSPVTMTFANVFFEGFTSLEITDEGPAPPEGFMLGDPLTYFEIDTTAAYYGVEICIDYSGISYVDESDLALNHYEESLDKWVDVTTSHDMVNDVICGYVEFLSPFAVFEEMNKPPSADANGPYEADEGAALAFDATGSSDPDGDDLIYAWDFGDGEVGSGATPAHAYGDDGEFVVTLVVSDPEGLSDSVTTTATIHNLPPSVDAGEDVSLFSGEVLTIAAAFVDPGTLDTHTATIDFGKGDGPEYAAVVQGAGSGTVSGSHQYFLPGSYTIEVCVRDDDGGESCDGFVLHVGAVPVEIDIWPHHRGHWPACRSPRSIIPVAILSSDTFDATLVDPLTVRFGPDEAEVIQWKHRGRAFAFLRDVNHDGLVDLQLYFRYGDTGLTCASWTASLHGQTVEGVYFLGEDNIRCWPWWRHFNWSQRWRK